MDSAVASLAGIEGDTPDPTRRRRDHPEGVITSARFLMAGQPPCRCETHMEQGMVEVTAVLPSASTCTAAHKKPRNKPRNRI